MAQNDSTLLGNVGTLLYIEWLVVKLDIWVEHASTVEGGTKKRGKKVEWRGSNMSQFVFGETYAVYSQRVNP